MIAPWLILVAALGGAFLALRGRGVIRHPDGSVEEWDDRGPAHDLVKWGGIAGVTIAGMSLAFFGSPAGLAILSGGLKTAGTTSAPPVGPPNAPTGVATVVIDTSTVYAFGSAFAGSGGDTQDSIRYAITRLAADTTAILTEVKTGAAQVRDTIADNTNLKADTTYKSWLKYHGVSGGWSAWSAPDTFVNALISDALFHSDWSTGTGFSDAILRDTAKAIPWSSPVIGNNDSMNVVAATGLGFPGGMSNVFRNKVNAAGQAGIVRYTGLTVPAIGESRYYRWYIRMVGSDAHRENGNSVEQHPIQDGQAIGNSNWAWTIRWGNGITAGKWIMSFEFDNSSAQATANTPNHWFGEHAAGALEFDKNHTYRVEFHISRIGTTTFNAHVRVYNESGTLVADDDEFQNSNNSGTLADVPTLTFNNVANLNGINAGQNDITSPDSAYLAHYQGGVCVRTNDWCGVYAGGI